MNGRFGNDVRLYNGVPPASAFASPVGTPLIINYNTGIMYILTPTGSVLQVGGGSAPPGLYPIDFMLTGVLAICGLQQLVTAPLNGKCVRIRRSSDNAEQDFGFTGTPGAFDSASALTFTGASDGFVVTFYDSSAAGNHFTQGTAANQAKIISAGSYLGTVQFGLTSLFCGYQCINTSPTSTGKSIFMKWSIRAYAATNVCYEYGDASTLGTASGNGQLQCNNVSGGDRMVNYSAQTGAGSSFSQTTWQTFGVANGLTQGHTFTRGTTPFYVGANLFTNGGPVPIQSGGAGSQDVGAGATGTPFPAYKWRVGCRTDGIGTQMNLNSFVIYDKDASSNAVFIVAAMN